MFTRKVYQDETAPAFALLVVTLRKYGMEALDYEPELLRAEIDKDYDIRLSNLQSDKIQAAFTIMHTDHFEHDWRVFETVSHLLNNSPVSHDDLNPLEAEEIATALAEFTLIKEGTLEDKEVIQYGDEVRAYAGQVFWDYGLHKAPKLFPTAIMPKSVKCDDTAKNEALKEIFDAKVNTILEYLEKIE